MSRNPRADVQTCWQLSRPDRSWSEHIVVDGRIQYSTHLPYVPCSKCSGTFASGRILPFKCPQEIRDEIEALRQESPVLSADQFERKAARWQAALHKYGTEIVLIPGDAFPPRLWSVPSPPEHDLFWPLPRSIVVSERIVRQFQQNDIIGASFRPIMLDRVGSVNDGSIQEIADMDDYFERLPRTADSLLYGRFFEMTIEAATAPSPEEDVRIYTCAECGTVSREESVEYEERLEHWRSARVLPVQYGSDSCLFWSHIFFEGFVAKDSVFRSLSEELLTNCNVTRLRVSRTE